MFGLITNCCQRIHTAKVHETSKAEDQTENKTNDQEVETLLGEEVAFDNDRKE